MGPDDEEPAGAVEIYDTERGEWTELSWVELGDPAFQAEQVLLETTEWVPLDLDKALRPPNAIFRTGGGLIIDWGWRRLAIGRRPWLPMGHPPPTWRRGWLSYYGKGAWRCDGDGFVTL